MWPPDGVEGILWAFQTLKWKLGSSELAQEQALSPRDDISLAPEDMGVKRGHSSPKHLIQKSFKGGKEHRLVYLTWSLRNEFLERVEFCKHGLDVKLLHSYGKVIGKEKNLP